MRLKDKVAIITGGAEGIGQAYALGFAKEGAKVVVADINFTAAKSLAARLIKQGNEALATNTDVANTADTEEMVKKTIERFGRIDILVNNAAMFQRNPAVRTLCWEMDPADFEKVIKVNVTGVFLCCRAALPYMIKQKSGKIINIASSLAFLGAVNLTHYSASKGAVVTFSRALAREVGPYNINVNSLCPGFTLSADPDSITEERRQYEVPARILKRPEYPEDLVGTAIYLASSDSDFMTGQAVVVDGGVAFH
jgi:NAD(P)-dependent dehydrogenase (short-subunit alcohol dehydrogenase family)